MGCSNRTGAGEAVFDFLFLRIGLSDFLISDFSSIHTFLFCGSIADKQVEYARNLPEILNDVGFDDRQRYAGLPLR
jgi:hypothetical protein